MKVLKVEYIQNNYECIDISKSIAAVEFWMENGNGNYYFWWTNVESFSI